MAIAAGTKLGVYEIVEPLGAGGMGEVYRARDSKLKREVAIKVLPEAFARDGDRVTRFQREAQVLASLNHPHIAAIHDIQELGEQRFLVLEFVDGETLADRIARGPIPLNEAFPIAKQIAEALEAAHEQGIIHRDLKPANVKITPDGNVKVLDFGLAKALESAPANLDISQSPTLSMAATNAGVILGTAAYMSPEQARGKAADKRADIWAFGCVLYEMLTGGRAFEGDDIADIFAAVIRSEPNWHKLPVETPQPIRQLIRRCLEKNRKGRLPDIAMARIEIGDALSIPVQTTAAPAETISSNRARVSWAFAALFAVAFAATLAFWSPWQTTAPPPPLRLTAELGADVSLATDVIGNSSIAISPDGAALAFIGTKDGINEIYVRRLEQLQASPLSGTVGAVSPFFSPDGEWLAFFADNKLKKISTSGGAAVTLCDAPNARGGAWGDDGNIVFSPNLASVLFRVSSAGGKPEPVTRFRQGEISHRWPYVLPGSKAVLYAASLATQAWDSANIILQPLPDGVAKVMLQGAYKAQYLASDHIVYIHKGTLFGVPFDAARLEVTGPSVPVVEDVTANAINGSAQFAASNSGTLAYLSGTSNAAARPILWVSQDGKSIPLRPAASEWSNPRFAPNGRSLAIDMSDGRQTDVWVYEWARDTLTRLTFDPGDDRKPVWTPEGRRITFASTRENSPLNLYWQRADGTGEVQRLTESPNLQLPASWHPSGRYLAFHETHSQTGDDLMILPVAGNEISGWKPGKPTVYLNSRALEVGPMFSPDGRWIAYTSNESGRNEIFVRPFPGPGGKWQISADGGLDPVWSQTRRELFYRTPDNRVMVVPYSAEGDSFNADRPRLWMEQPIVPRPRNQWFDVHPDGNRLAAAAPTGTQGEEKRDKVTFSFNFLDELRRIAPASRQ
jgi:serine/threonine-protein kinase